MGLNLNINSNFTKRKELFPLAGLDVIVYPETYESGGTTFYKTSTGVGLDVVGQDVDGEDIINFAPLNDARFDKGSYVGNAYGLPEYYDFPFVNIYFDETSETTRYHWKLTDFHYRWLEAQSVGLTNWAFGKLNYTDASYVDAERILIYENALIGNNLSKAINYSNLIYNTNYDVYFYINEQPYISTLNPFIYLSVDYSSILSDATLISKVCSYPKCDLYGLQTTQDYKPVLTTDSIWFDGIDDFLEVNNQVAINDQAFAIGFWVKQSRLGVREVLFDTGALGLKVAWHIEIMETGTILFRIGDGDNRYQIISSYSLVTEWTYVVCRYDGLNKQQILVNSILDTELLIGDHTIPVGLSYNLKIGYDNFYTFPYEGYLNDIFIKFDFLTETEIINIYNSTKSKYGL